MLSAATSSPAAQGASGSTAPGSWTTGSGLFAPDVGEHARTDLSSACRGGDDPRADVFIAECADVDALAGALGAECQAVAAQLAAVCNDPLQQGRSASSKPCGAACGLAILVAEWSTWRSSTGLNSTEKCIPSLAALARALELLRPWTWKLRPFYNHWRLACSEGHQQDILRRDRLRRALHAAHAVQGGASGSSGAPWRVAIVAGATADSLETYRPFAALWECYAQRHGYEFVLDVVNDASLAPPRFEFAWSLRRMRGGGSHRAGRLRPKRNWVSLLAARRQVSKYDAILVTDFDAFVSPSCLRMPLDFLWLAGSEHVVAVRDAPRHHDPNMGVFAVRGGAAGAAFLDEVLAKRHWLVTPRPVQNAFTETLLELLWRERWAAGDGSGEPYRAWCLPYAFAEVDWSFRAAEYARCFHETLEALAGPFGGRSASSVRFVDPRQVDMNYLPRPWEPGGRGFVQHHAGAKNWTAMLAGFGLTRARAMRPRVCAHVQRFAKRLRPCAPGTEVSPCPAADDRELIFDVC